MGKSIMEKKGWTAVTKDKLVWKKGNWQIEVHRGRSVRGMYGVRGWALSVTLYYRTDTKTYDVAYATSTWAFRREAPRWMLGYVEALTPYLEIYHPSLLNSLAKYLVAKANLEADMKKYWEDYTDPVYIHEDTIRDRLTPRTYFDMDTRTAVSKATYDSISQAILKIADFMFERRDWALKHYLELEVELARLEKTLDFINTRNEWLQKKGGE